MAKKKVTTQVQPQAPVDPVAPAPFDFGGAAKQRRQLEFEMNRSDQGSARQKAFADKLAAQRTSIQTAKKAAGMPVTHAEGVTGEQMVANQAKKQKDYSKYERLSPGVYRAPSGELYKPPGGVLPGRGGQEPAKREKRVGGAPAAPTQGATPPAQTGTPPTQQPPAITPPTQQPPTTGGPEPAPPGMARPPTGGPEPFPGQGGQQPPGGYQPGGQVYGGNYGGTGNPTDNPYGMFSQNWSAQAPQMPGFQYQQGYFGQFQGPQGGQQQMGSSPGFQDNPRPPGMQGDMAPGAQPPGQGYAGPQGQMTPQSMLGDIYNRSTAGTDAQFNTSANRLRERLDAQTEGLLETQRGRNIGRGFGTSGMQDTDAFRINQGAQTAYGEGLNQLSNQFEALRQQGLQTGLGAAGQAQQGMENYNQLRQLDLSQLRNLGQQGFQFGAEQDLRNRQFMDNLRYNIFGQREQQGSAERIAGENRASSERMGQNEAENANWRAAMQNLFNQMGQGGQLGGNQGGGGMAPPSLVGSIGGGASMGGRPMGGGGLAGAVGGAPNPAGQMFLGSQGGPVRNFPTQPSNPFQRFF